MSLFGANLFSTPVGQKIEQATDASLASENWSLNMEICDIINENEDAAKDAIRAIRKRLQQNAGKNYTVVMYALTVLETCVKNCGRRLHLLATNKEFVQDLVKLIGPKNDPPTVVQEKVLSLIQSWADAFKGNPEMSGVIQVYHDLKAKGIEFPMTDLDAMAPIHTPQRVMETEPVTPAKPVRVPSAVAQQRQPMPPAGMMPPAGPPPPPGPVVLNQEQLGKLRSELDVVQSNMTVLAEMLTELAPGKEHPSDFQLLQDLYKTCKVMQNRLVELIDRVATEEVTSELLRVNDELNNLFLRYERYDKNRWGMAQGAGDAPRPLPAEPMPAAAAEPSLIDLSDEAAAPASTLPSQLAGLSVTSVPATAALSQVNSVPAQKGSLEDDFDMFAQSRTASYETNKQSGSTYADNASHQTSQSLGTVAEARHTKLQKEADFDEMEAWLKEQTPETLAAFNMHGSDVLEPKPQTDGQGDSITSTEFERFLAERAAAATDTPAEAAAAASAGSRTNTRSRQMNKEETENRLFAL